MKQLSPPQERFAQLVASGVSQTDAYRQAYPTSLNWKPESCHQKSSVLAADVHVRSRIEALRKPVVEAVRAEAKITLESHLAEIDRIKKLAEAKEEYNTALKAEELRGKAVGLYVTKTEDVTDPMKKAMGRMTPGDAQAALDALEQVRAIREKSKSAT